MNKKIEEIAKELSQMYQKKTAIITELEKQLKDAEANIEKYAAEMTEAAKNENFKEYQSAETSKRYYEGRISFISDKLEEAKKGAEKGYEKYQQAIISAFEDEYKAFLKVIVADSIKHDEMQQQQREKFKEAQGVMDLLNDLYNKAGTSTPLNIMNYTNGWQWASHNVRSGVFNWAVNKYPEFLKK